MHCSKGVHKSLQTSSGAAEVHRHKVSDLHGRYTTDGQLKATNSGADLHSSVSPGEPLLAFIRSGEALLTFSGEGKVLLATGSIDETACLHCLP